LQPQREPLSTAETVNQARAPHLDPPYWETTGYGVPFDLSQYELMADLLSKLQGKALLSINDHPEMRRIFASFPVVETSLRYTIGASGRDKQRGELIYRINC
jgi:DNA adenine methylase